MPRAAKPDAAAAALVGLRRIVRFLRLADREIEAACGLSAAQLFVLHAIASAPGLSLGELAARTLTDQSSVSTVVARLSAAKLVARKVDQRDRRRAALALTAAGRAVLARAPKAPQERLIDAIREMPAARRAELVRALDGLTAALGADDTAPKMLFED